MQYRKIFDSNPGQDQKDINRKQGWMLVGLVLALIFLLYSPTSLGMEITPQEAASATDPSYQKALAQNSFEGDEAATVVVAELFKKWFNNQQRVETLYLGQYGSTPNVKAASRYDLGLSGEAIAFKVSFNF